MKPLSRRDFLKATGLLAAAPLATALSRIVPAAAEKRHPDVLLLVFDTLSARHMALYGYPRPTTPNLERLAKVSTVYHQHWAGGNFTVPGTATLLSGTYPWTHRALHLYGSMLPEASRHTLFSAFSSIRHTLAYTHNPLANILLSQIRDDIDDLLPMSRLMFDDDHLANLFPADYEPAYNAEQIVRRVAKAGEFQPPSLLFLSVWDSFYQAIRDTRYNRQYHEQFPRGVPSHAREAYFLLEDAIRWLSKEVSAPASKPMLRYVHLLPPHEPYTPESAFVDIFLNTETGVPPKPLHPLTSRTDKQYRLSQPELEYQRRMYDEYLAYADHNLGNLLDTMEESGALGNTIVVFTSDHGQLFERGIHAHNTPLLYEGLLHIPLLIHLPGQTSRLDVETPTSAADILPTLAHLLGRPLSGPVEGHILPPFASYEEHPVFAVEAKESSKWGHLQRASFAMRLGKHKLIHYRGYPEAPDTWELYNLENDPEELENIFADDPRAAALQNILLQKLEEKA